MDIIIEPWKKLIIHEIIEYKFEDWVKQKIHKNYNNKTHRKRQSRFCRMRSVQKIW